MLPPALWASYEQTQGKCRMTRSVLNISVLLGATLLLYHPGEAKACNTGCKAPALVIEPGKRAGPVTKDISEAQLKASLQQGEVIRLLVHLEEDAYQCGTAIFPG